MSGIGVTGLVLRLQPGLWKNQYFIDAITGLLVLVILYALWMGITESFMKWRTVKKFIKRAEAFAYKNGNLREDSLIETSKDKKTITFHDPEILLDHDDFIYFMKKFCDGLALSGAFKDGLVMRVYERIHSIYKAAFGEKHGNPIGTTGVKFAFKDVALYLKEDVFSDFNEHSFNEDAFKAWKLKAFEDFSRPQ